MSTANLEQMIEEIFSPTNAKEVVPISESAKETVRQGRESIKRILNREDTKLIVITGPCSVNNYKSAIEYAKKLRDLSEKIRDTMLLVMRVYVEKPRTKLGWKGYLNDPGLDGSYDLNKGILETRRLLNEINEIGVMAATEFLSPHSNKYIGDLVSWAAIGARTTEAPFYAELASGLDIPIGFKNTTDGSIEKAVNSIVKSNSPHSYIDSDESGKYIKISTKGNPYSHLILRGGKKPNYDTESISYAIQLLKKESLPANIIIDCSHGNSQKEFKRQTEILKEVVKQRKSNFNIIGVMLESNLKEGSQKLSGNIIYGVSVTDSCIGWEATEYAIKEAYQNLNTLMS